MSRGESTRVSGCFIVGAGWTARATVEHRRAHVRGRRVSGSGDESARSSSRRTKITRAGKVLARFFVAASLAAPRPRLWSGRRAERSWEVEALDGARVSVRRPSRWAPRRRGARRRSSTGKHRPWCSPWSWRSASRRSPATPRSQVGRPKRAPGRKRTTFRRRPLRTIPRTPLSFRARRSTPPGRSTRRRRSTPGTLSTRIRRTRRLRRRARRPRRGRLGPHTRHAARRRRRARHRLSIRRALRRLPPRRQSRRPPR